jgi:DNA-binding transcriptional ArsR family regulator
LTELDDAMLEHMEYLVYVEKRTFSFKDFCRFEVKGKEYKMSHGTFRNKISKLNKKGIVKLAYISQIAFYTLQVKRFDTSAITHGHTGGTITSYNNSINRRWRNSNSSATNHNHKTGNGYLYDLIMNLPLEHNSIHDIRLNFKVKGIWSVLYNHYNNNNKYSNIEL